MALQRCFPWNPRGETALTLLYSGTLFQFSYQIQKFASWFSTWSDKSNSGANIQPRCDFRGEILILPERINYFKCKMRILIPSSLDLLLPPWFHLYSPAGRTMKSLAHGMKVYLLSYYLLLSWPQTYSLRLGGYLQQLQLCISSIWAPFSSFCWFYILTVSWAVKITASCATSNRDQERGWWRTEVEGWCAGRVDDGFQGVQRCCQSWVRDTCMILYDHMSLLLSKWDNKSTTRQDNITLSL